MKYGCIGNPLGHSFSVDIHEAIGRYPYELCELEARDLPRFFYHKDFLAINVTIPFKRMILPLIDELDETAKAIGSVNTVVNRGGKLYGYNTDLPGMRSAFRRAKVSLKNKRILILGTGGTSRTATAFAREEGAQRIRLVSRTGKDGASTYEEVRREHGHDHVIINTTPAGMYPKIESVPLDPLGLPLVSYVFDAVFNPLSTRLVERSRRNGIPTQGGLYMLAAQGVGAAELFLDKRLPAGLTDRVYTKVLLKKRNIVLIGMPSSGKTAVGRILAGMTGRRLIDTDEEISRLTGRSIAQLIGALGVKGFRRLESELIEHIAGETGVIISTGGGTPLEKGNMIRLRLNGRIFWLDRPLDLLKPSADRPLADTQKKLAALYAERLPIYRAAASDRIPADASAREVAAAVLAAHRQAILF